MGEAEFKGLTQLEVDQMITIQLEKHDHAIREMGCQSKNGCLAGKKHFQEHELKWSSDLYNLKTFKDEQQSENKLVSRKMSEITTVFHDVVKDLSYLLRAFAKTEDDIDKYKDDQKVEQEKKWKEQNKRINKHESRFWWMVGIVVAASILSVWGSNMPKTGVPRVNTGKQADELIRMHKGYFGTTQEKISKETKDNGRNKIDK